jgi:hypothetical protein
MAPHAQRGGRATADCPFTDELEPSPAIISRDCSEREESKEPPGQTQCVPFRVGLLLESLDQPAWTYFTIERLVHREDVQLTVVALAPRREPSSRRDLGLRSLRASGLVAMFERLDEQVFRPHPDPFAMHNLAPLLDCSPTASNELVSTQTCVQVPPKDGCSVRAQDLDVLLYFGDRTSFSEGLLSLARHGLWLFRHGSPPPYPGAAGGFWETVAGELTATAVLVAVHDSGAEEELCKSVVATHPTSAARTRAALYWTSTSFPERALGRLRGVAAVGPAPGELSATAPSMMTEALTASANRTMTRLTPRFLERTARFGVRRVFEHPQWFLAYTWAEQGPVPSLAHALELAPPDDRFWADPHVVCREGRYYVFVEELIYSRGRGHIAVLVLDRSGLIHGPATVLERPYHLSYPFLFEHEGSLYMIPETSQNGTIELYRCAEFPTRWEFVRNLMEGVSAMDATLVNHEGAWWLFTCMRATQGADPNVDLFLFTTPDPISGEWTSHPRNPVVSDVRNARPAGAILRHGGRLYRPSQQCVPHYGYAVRINEILTMTGQEYKECDAGCLLPDWRGGLIGTHTLSRADDMTIVDGLRWRLPPLKRDLLTSLAARQAIPRVVR